MPSLSQLAASLDPRASTPYSSLSKEHGKPWLSGHSGCLDSRGFASGCSWKMLNLAGPRTSHFAEFLGEEKIPFHPTLVVQRSGQETPLPWEQGRRCQRGEGAAKGVAELSRRQSVPPGCPQRRTLTILQIPLMHLEYTGGKKMFSDSQKYYKKSRAGETHPALQ